MEELELVLEVELADHARFDIFGQQRAFGNLMRFAAHLTGLRHAGSAHDYPFLGALFAAA